jgi:hypothetical protein
MKILHLFKESFLSEKIKEKMRFSKRNAL